MASMLESAVATYRPITQNRTLLAVWISRVVATIGDAFFNLAILWAVYINSGSIMQAALIQVFFHVPAIVINPYAGVMADRANRKHILVVSNLAATLVIGGFSLWIIAGDGITTTNAVIIVILVNSATTFASPAGRSIIPSIVEREHLSTVTGWFGASYQVSALIGASLGGLVIAAFGANAAVLITVMTFLFATVALARTSIPPGAGTESGNQGSLLRQLLDGWHTLRGLAVVPTLVWLCVFINFASFIGPMYPALIVDRLRGGASVYGFLQAMEIIAGVLAGLVAGRLERTFGAGWLVIAGWTLAAIATFGVSRSVHIPLTLPLAGIMVFGLVIAAVASNALIAALVPDEFRGRIFGLYGSLVVIAIPISTLAAGWIADIVGVAAMFGAAGAIMLIAALMALANRTLREAQI